MNGLRRRTVTEWYRCQSKYKVMYNSHADRFQIRDLVNNIAVGDHMTYDDAVEWCFDLAHGTLWTEGQYLQLNGLDRGK